MIMAATIHTDAQARVQEELDNVVGRTRRGLWLLFSALEVHLI